MSRHDLDHPASDHPDPGFRILSLATGVVLALLLVLFPRVAMDRWGGADPLAAGVLLWAMGAGFASGLGLDRPFPDILGHLFGMKEAGIGDAVHLAPGQQAEAAQLGQGGVDVLAVTIDGMDGAAALQQGLFELFSSVFTQITLAKEEIHL